MTREVSVEKDRDGIHVEMIPRYNYISGWMSVRNALGFHDEDERVEGVFLEEEWSVYNNYGSGRNMDYARRIKLRFDNIDAVERAHDRLEDRRKYAANEGAYDYSEDISDFWLPIAPDIEAEIEDSDEEGISL